MLYSCTCAVLYYWILTSSDTHVYYNSFTDSFIELSCVYRYGAGSGTILLTEVDCDDDTSHLLRCGVQGINQLSTSCDHQQDVAVVCCESNMIYM